MRQVLAAILAVAAASGLVRAESRPVDADRSKLTVYVYKSGLFSAFADDHVIDAPIARGTLSADGTLSVAIEVQAASLVVRDPKLSAGKRAEVQARMVGPEVLDTERFPSIAFASDRVEASGTDRFTVSGRLTIHGQTRPVSFAAVRASGRYTGSVSVKQRDFGMTPISIAGGAVKVKDEIKIEFDIVSR